MVLKFPHHESIGLDIYLGYKSWFPIDFPIHWWDGLGFCPSGRTMRCRWEMVTTSRSVASMHRWLADHPMGPMRPMGRNSWNRENPEINKVTGAENIWKPEWKPSGWVPWLNCASFRFRCCLGAEFQHPRDTVRAFLGHLWRSSHGSTNVVTLFENTSPKWVINWLSHLLNIFGYPLSTKNSISLVVPFLWKILSSKLLHKDIHKFLRNQFTGLSPPWVKWVK